MQPLVLGPTSYIITAMQPLVLLARSAIIAILLLSCLYLISHACRYVRRLPWPCRMCPISLHTPLRLGTGLLSVFNLNRRSCMRMGAQHIARASELPTHGRCHTSTRSSVLQFVRRWKAEVRRRWEAGTSYVRGNWKGVVCWFRGSAWRVAGDQRQCGSRWFRARQTIADGVGVPDLELEDLRQSNATGDGFVPARTARAAKQHTWDEEDMIGVTVVEERGRKHSRAGYCEQRTMMREALERPRSTRINIRSCSDLENGGLDRFGAGYERGRGRWPCRV